MWKEKKNECTDFTFIVMCKLRQGIPKMDMAHFHDGSPSESFISLNASI